MEKHLQAILLVLLSDNKSKLLKEEREGCERAVDEDRERGILNVGVLYV